MTKITVIGAGNVGATCAQRLAERNYADIVLLDSVEGLPQGKALDILESGPVCKFDNGVVGTNDYEDTANSDVIIITSGSPRKPGMTRDDLLRINIKIVGEVARNIAAVSPESIIIMVTNPVEAMARLALEVSRFPANRIIGLSGVLDGARLASFIAAELKAPVETISTCTLGQHGESMVVVPRLCTVKGKALTELLPEEKIAGLVRRTISGGGEIVRLLKTGSAFYAPSAAVTAMVDAIVRDTKVTLNCTARLDGEYGIRDTFLTVPVKLGRNGIEQIVEFKLTADEKGQLLNSAKAVQEIVKAMESLNED